MPGRNVGGAAAFAEEKHVSRGKACLPRKGLLPEEGLGAGPKAVRRQRFGAANHRRFDAALWMARIPCMMIAGDTAPRCHYFAIKPNFGRICQFFRDFLARIPLTC
jgi:hypothetical protein